MADVPVLVCTAGELAGRRIPVPEGGLGIGRSAENAVVIHDEGVSRYHGRLLFENGSLWLQDAGSRNGVFVNGTRVTGHKALKVGDSITIAQHTFELRWLDEDRAGEPVRNGAPRAATSPRSADQQESINGARTQGPRSVPPEQRPTAGDTIPPTTEPAPRRRWYWPFS
jgi:predicted component of type VI protein secretion system